MCGLALTELTACGEGGFLNKLCDALYRKPSHGGLPAHIRSCLGEVLLKICSSEI